MGAENELDLVSRATAIKADLLGRKAEYEVISPVGLFKNGILHPQGAKIVMDKLTGGNQERAKAVKLLKDL